MLLTESGGLLIKVDSRDKCDSLEIVDELLLIFFVAAGDDEKVLGDDLEHSTMTHLCAVADLDVVVIHCKVELSLRATFTAKLPLSIRPNPKKPTS